MAIESVNTRVIQVKVPGHAYKVVVGRGAFAKSLEYIKQRKPSSLVVVADRNVARHCAGELKRLMAIKLVATNIKCIVAPGEKSKSLATFEKLYDICLGAKSPPDRDALVVALGGGVVGDLAGFFAATYLRGVDSIQIPTTLLAMVDSSVGGKTAINHPRGKNLIGAFHQPKAVFADIDFLETLPKREYVGALAEVVKYGIVLDAKMFSMLEKNADALLARKPKALSDAIVASIRNKAKVVAADPQEKGLRAVLNYGHTIGHALEKVDGYQKFKHGEAVSVGMQAATRIGLRAGITSRRACQRLRELLAALGLAREIPEGFSDKALLAALANDKKRRLTQLVFIVPVRIGSWRTYSCLHRDKALRWAREDIDD